MHEVAGRAELLLLAVPDAELASLVAGLAATAAVRPGTIVAHTSGANGIAVLAPLTEQGCIPLAIHPAMTFTGSDEDIDRLPDACFGITAADEVGYAIAQSLVLEIGGEPFRVREDARTLYHAALAHASNHVVTVVLDAVDALRTALWGQELLGQELVGDAPGGIAERVIGPLARASLENALQRGQAALTGPVARGDAAAVAGHLRALTEVDPQLAQAYRANSLRTAQRAHAPDDVFAVLDGSGAAMTMRKSPQFAAGELNVYARPRDISDVTRALRHTGRRVMLVPTMGALHDGHLALIRAAKRVQGAVVVVSIFVNPLQFGAGEDLDAYPRTLDDDLAVLRAEGVEMAFTPTAADMYPDGTRTSVHPGPLGDELEGASRPTHFAGVLTAVLKLLQIVRPDRAFFGEKDYQQLVLVRQMVADLNVDVQIVGVPIVREADGLALSSRNRYLNDVEREQAGALSAALLAGMYAASGGTAAALDAARAVLDEVPAIEVDYLQVRNTALGPAPPEGMGRMLVAARLGSDQIAGQHRHRHRSSRRHRRTITSRAGHASRIALEELMLRTMLKSKIHRARVTQADLHYVGSVTIDADLMDAADLLEGEQVTIVDIDNGARLVTYAITGERGSGVIGINGAAAHLVHPGDLVILIAYGTMEDAEARTYQPRVVFVDADNKQIDLGPDPAHVPADAADLMSPR